MAVGRLLRLSPDEATFKRRGFTLPSPAARERLEGIGRTFITGYNGALGASNLASLASALDATDPTLRGFAYEGAAMALTLLDLLLPKRSGRLEALLEGPGRLHLYLVHVGAGWALARLARGERDVPRSLDPLLRWLAFDGYGFHEGYFHPVRSFRDHTRSQRLSGYALRAYDQGLGRSLWFVEGADANRVAGVVSTFAAERRADLWSGVGLAAAYAGGTDEHGILLLRELAGAYTPHLSQGAAFAAKARESAGLATADTALACRVLCDSSASAAAGVTDAALVELNRKGDEPDYEIWRQRIRRRYSPEASFL
jgi:hypothetical protein